MIDPYLFKAPLERRENRAKPIDAAHARIGELIREYGSACAAYHSGPEVTRAYQACMAEIKNQFTQPPTGENHDL